MRKILLSLFAVLTASFAMAQTELLTNGGFEQWTEGVPTGWLIATSGSNTAGSNVAVAQSTEKHSGTYAVAITNTTADKTGSGQKNGRIASQELKLKAGTYTFSAYVRASEDAAASRIGYTVINLETGKPGDYNYSKNENNVSGPDTLTTEWLKKTMTFKLDAAATVCLVVMHSKNYINGTVLLDDASLTTTDGGIDDGTEPEPEPGIDFSSFEKITVAQFLEKADTEKQYLLEGIVTNVYQTTYGNFYLQEINNDEVTLNIYGTLKSDGKTTKAWKELGVEEKDTITVLAKYSTYNEKPQAQNVVYVSHKKFQGEKPTIKNTPETAYTVAQVKTLVDAGVALSDEVYVKGIISKINSVTAGGSATYFIVDKEGDEFSVQVYKGNYLENHTFDTANDIKVGDEVIVYGLLTLYQTTYEINSGNYIYSLNGKTTYVAKELVDITNTLETAYTVAKAIELMNDDKNDLTKQVFVKGFIVGTPDFQRKAADNTLYGNVNLNIADEKGGTTTLAIYRGKDFEGANFTEETIGRLKEGDEVVFQGLLQLYTKDEVTTPQLTSGKLASVNGETSGISSIANVKNTGAIFDLSGRRVSKAQKGIYIINGKKVVK